MFLSKKISKQRKEFDLVQKKTSPEKEIVKDDRKYPRHRYKIIPPLIKYQYPNHVYPLFGVSLPKRFIIYSKNY